MGRLMRLQTKRCSQSMTIVLQAPTAMLKKMKINFLK